MAIATGTAILVASIVGALATAATLITQSNVAQKAPEPEPLPALPELPQPTIEAPTKAEDIIKQ